MSRPIAEMPSASVLAAFGLTALLAGVAVFQLALIAGRPWGRLAWGGAHVVLPTNLRISSAVSIGIYALIAAAMLDRAGVLLWLPTAVSQPLAWTIAGYFGLGIGLNLASRSRPERLVMSPIVALLCLLSVAVALG
jgi:hypothetical protein